MNLQHSAGGPQYFHSHPSSLHVVHSKTHSISLDYIAINGYCELIPLGDLNSLSSFWMHILGFVFCQSFFFVFCWVGSHSLSISLSFLLHQKEIIKTSSPTTAKKNRSNSSQQNHPFVPIELKLFILIDFNENMNKKKKGRVEKSQDFP